MTTTTTITPIHSGRFRQTVFVAVLGAIAGAVLTIGISALLRDDKSGPAQAKDVTASAGPGLATADAAEHWLTHERVADADRSIPRSADAAEQWIGISVRPSALPLSSDALEHWIGSTLPSRVVPSSADAAEQWLTSD